MEKTEAQKEYDKIYQRCMYEARKELVLKHNEDYTKLLDSKLLEVGIISRRKRAQYNDKLINTIKQGE